MPKPLTLRAKGLWNNANPLTAPEGALETANNVVIRRPGVVETRRGLRPDDEAASTDVIDAVGEFAGLVISHAEDGTISRRVSASSRVDYAGTWEAPEGAPMRFWEAQGAFYASTATGVIRLDDVAGEWEAAGVPPGLEGSGTTTGSSGWLANNEQVAVRFVWGRRDGDGHLLLGAPSGRIVVRNTTGGTRNVSYTIPIPPGITAGTHFLQVYRTKAVSTSLDPGENMAQVLEVFPNATEVSAGTFTVEDISPLPNGATAYFAPIQGGIGASKLRPPVITDAVVFKGHTFGVVRAYEETLTLTLTAIGGSTGLATGQGLYFTQGGTFLFAVSANASENFATGDFQLFTSGTAAENIDATARSLVRVLNNYPDSAVFATYTSSTSDIPGQLTITAREQGGAPIAVQAFANPLPWLPNLGARLFVTSISRTGSTVTATLTPTSAAQALEVGQVLQMTTVDPLPADPDFPLGLKTITAVNTGAGTFSYTEAGSAVTGTKDTYVFETTDSPVTMTQEAEPDSYAMSAYQEPDAWPPGNRFNVAGPNVTLHRIIQQGDRLLFFTNAGIYYLTGNNENDFNLRPLESTARLVGQNTVVALGNKVLALTEQGVILVDDSGITNVSGPIEESLRPFYSSTDERRAAAEAAGFAIAYEAESEYYLFLPSEEAVEGDPAVQAFVYNLNTDTWVRHTYQWDGINSGGAVQTGLAPKFDQRLYLAAAEFLCRERKDRATSDYQDATGAGIPSEVAWVVQTGGDPSSSKQWQEVVVLFESPRPTGISMLFSTEVSTTPEGGTIPANSPLGARTYVPLEKSRSARLTVDIQHSTANQAMKILGLGVAYNGSGMKIGR